MIVAGIATFIQAPPLWKIGSGLPIFMGLSFTFIIPLTAVAQKYGYGAVMGTALAGLFPPVGRFIRTIPESVMGGMLLVVLGQILVSGFEMVAAAGFTPKNKLIAAVSLSVAIGFTASTEAGIWDNMPVAIQSIFAQNSVAVIFAIAMVMNLLLQRNMGAAEAETK